MWEGSFNKDYTKTYIGQYTKEYQKEYTGSYEGNYVKSYTGQYDHLWSGLTIDNSTENISTIKLWLRVA